MARTYDNVVSLAKELEQRLLSLEAQSSSEPLTEILSVLRGFLSLQVLLAHQIQRIEDGQETSRDPLDLPAFLRPRNRS